MEKGEKDKKALKKTKSKFILLNENLKKDFPDRMMYFDKVKLSFDPVAHQRKERDEWE